MDTVKRSIHLDSTGWLWTKEPVPFLPLLNEALWLGQKVEVEYRRHDGQIRQRVIDPYVWWSTVVALPAPAIFQS